MSVPEPNTELLVRGLPPNVDAAEMHAAFGRHGLIAKIEINGDTAIVNYTDRSSRNNALQGKYIIRNSTLHVGRYRRRDSKKPKKRGFDNTSKNSSKGQTSSKKDKKPSIVAQLVLDALAQPAPLSQQMTILKEIILMKPENCSQICNIICSDVMNTMRASGFKTCELYAFGSMTTGLAFKGSDLDIYAYAELSPKFQRKGLDALGKEKQVYGRVKSSFYGRAKLFKDIVPIQRAKIPLIKFVHCKTNVACDLNFRDAIGHYNSNLLWHYLDMNERFFDLIVFLKYWAQIHEFCSMSKFSSYAVCMLGLSFLLSLKTEDGHRIVPTVDELLNDAQSPNRDIYISDWKCSFNNTPMKVTLPDSPNYLLMGLLKGFFEYMASVSFPTDVLSVSTGGLIPRELFDRPDELPTAYICYKNYIAKHPQEVLVKPTHYGVIHDPFRLNHNLIGRVDPVTIKIFVQACKKAAENCAVAMNNEEMESRLLHQLLGGKPQSQVAVQGTSQIKECGPLILVNPFLGNADPYEDLSNLICMIFEKILLFNVSKLKEEPESGTDCKVIKTDDMKDVHENSHIHTVIVCEGEKNVWQGRRKVKQSLKLNNPLSLQDEVNVSQFLEQTKLEHPVDVRISFRSKLTNDGDIYKLLFEPSETCSDFKVFQSHIVNVLPKWVLGLSEELGKSDFKQLK